MKLVLNMVIKNEMDRYLQACIMHHWPLVDSIFIMDDRSDDIDPALLKKWGVEHIAVRGKNQPSFIQNEAAFRQAGWERMAEVCELESGDWVLGLDADEFLVGAEPLPLAVAACGQNYDSISFSIPEMYSIDPPQERTDGYWASITGLRMTRYRPGDQSFPWEGMGCGVFPAYASKGRVWSELLEHFGRILHYGYANVTDRNEKFARYSRESNNHAGSHIKSILEAPTTTKWTSATAEVWRGVR